MANPEHIAALRAGVQHWHEWRLNTSHTFPDLRDANLTGADLSESDLSAAMLSGAKLSGANLTKANLIAANLSQAELLGANLKEASLLSANLVGANLSTADLTGATFVNANLSGANLNGARLWEANLLNVNLTGADLTGTTISDADLSGANLSGANLSGADLSGTMLFGTNLRRANMSGTNLRLAILIDTVLDGAVLTGASVYGISAWNLSLEGAVQNDLTMQRSNEDAPITIDDLEMAQFIYLLLNNKRLRNVIDSITSKVVLILGRFTQERKAVLDALRDELRRRNFLPILFDFEKPANRDRTETISTLAHMGRFIIADLTDARSLPQELTRIVPILPSVPVQPILLASGREWAIYEDIARYPWVLPIARYISQDALLAGLQTEIIDPVERKSKEQIR
jgi:uncharacterized protein YjbI with pentapeptide repeats